MYEARLVGTGLNRNTDNTVGYLTLNGGANFRVQDRRLRFLIFSATFLIIFYSRLDRYRVSEFSFFWQAFCFLAGKVTRRLRGIKKTSLSSYLSGAGGGNRTDGPR